MSIARVAPYGAITNSDGTPGSGTEWTAEWHQGFLDLIDARWSALSVVVNGGLQHDVAITGTDGREADYVYWNGTTDTVMTGIQVPIHTAAKPLYIRNASPTGATLSFAHYHSGSQLHNRLYNIAQSASTPIGAGGTATYIFDGNIWVLHNHEPGWWITRAYNSANYAGNASMVWTVESGDVLFDRYQLRGRTLLWHLSVATSSVSGTPNVFLIANIPNGFAAAQSVVSDGCDHYNTTGWVNGFWNAVANQTNINFGFRTVGSMGTGTWGSSTNGIIVQAVMQFEVT